MAETTVGKVKIGSGVELAADAYPGQLFKGEVEAFDAKLNQDARMLMVRARLPNPDRKLMPGMFANIAVLAGGAKDFVTVPRTALTYGLYGDSVWVVKEGAPEPAAAPTPTAAGEPVASAVAADAAPTGSIPAQPKLTVERRFVHVGPTEEDRVAILDGIKEGEQVVTSGQLKLQPGATIKVDNSGRCKRRRSCPSNKPMAFTDIFIKRPVLATVVSLLILLVGAQAGFKLPIRQYPELSNTTITVVTTYPGAQHRPDPGLHHRADPAGGGERRRHRHDDCILDAECQHGHAQPEARRRSRPGDDRRVVESGPGQGHPAAGGERSVVTKQTGEGYALMYLSFNSKVMNASQISDYITRVVQPRLQTINGVANARDARWTGVRHAHLARSRSHRLARGDAARCARRRSPPTIPLGARPSEGRYVQTNIDAKTSLQTPECVRQAGGDGPRRMPGQAG